MSARKLKDGEGGCTVEAVDHPAHYNALPATCKNCGHPIECIDVAEHMTFSLGNVLKYIWRGDSKGKLLEDLKKAAKYLEFEIERVSRAP